MTDLPELSEGERALRTVERDWNAAAQHWDSESLAALYTDDALFYGGRPGHAVGHAKVREGFDSTSARLLPPGSRWSTRNCEN